MDTSQMLRGVVHGKTIELEHSPGLPNGQSVVVTLQTTETSQRLAPNEGILRSAGAWADDADDLDEFLEWASRHKAPRTYAWYRENVQRFLDGAQVRKVIVVPDRLVNIVV